MNEYLLVISTAPSKEEGNAIALKIVEERLAACVTVTSAVQSFYWWEDRIANDQEFILFIKTKTTLFPKLEDRIKILHSYQVPEIIALPIHAGSKEYLDWISQNTRP
jgi:periplasmic divalent cation tolerance protein